MGLPSRPLGTFRLALLAALAGTCAACGTRPPPEPPTPAPTALPTATVVPLAVTDAVARPPTRAPDPAPGAPCGLVDTLDFPVGPPDGEGYSARWSFGRDSSRYKKLHAGEDWVIGGGSTLGKPVFAIGHGQVVYANPYGWGQVDRGVIIVRHVFPDGEDKLSFYGHVQPETVTLRPGACVRRGDELALVDKPRGRPHLHFEVRDHLPNEPGPGYWPRDPRTAGWYPPSDYIQALRLGLTPGVRWLQPYTTSLRAASIGTLSDGSLMVHDGEQLTALDPASGQPRWRSDLLGEIAAAVIDQTGQAVYVIDEAGRVLAYTAGTDAPPTAEQLSPNQTAATIVGVRPDRRGGSSLRAPAWTAAPDGAGSSLLLPLPGGGVATYGSGGLVGLAPDGSQRWVRREALRPAGWALVGERLVLSTDYPEPRLYSLDAGGTLVGPGDPGGELTAWGPRAALLRPDGIYAVDPATASRSLLLPLSSGALRSGQILALPDGGLLATHRGPGQRELVALGADGALRWRRSLAALGNEFPRLVVAGPTVLAVSPGEVYQLDLSRGNAARIFSTFGAAGGRGSPLAAGTGAGLLLDFHAGYLLLLTPPEPAQTGGG